MTRRIALIASKGTLDQAYPPLILATSAASLGWEAGIFFTFYGLDIINKKKFKKLKVPAVGNPAMPVPVPTLLGALPGMTAVATAMMGSWMSKSNMPKLPEFLSMCKEQGVKLYACSTTMGVMGVKPEDLLDGVEIAGATAFLDYASESKIQLFI
jgi:peroxiredoxin family protein